MAGITMLLIRLLLMLLLTKHHPMDAKTSNNFQSEYTENRVEHSRVQQQQQQQQQQHILLQQNTFNIILQRAQNHTLHRSLAKQVSSTPSRQISHDFQQSYKQQSAADGLYNERQQRQQHFYQNHLIATTAQPLQVHTPKSMPYKQQINTAQFPIANDNDDNDDYPSADQDYIGDDPSQAGNSLTNLKNEELGTPEAVKKSHTRYLESRKTHLAIEHINRMKIESKCSRPQPRVIPVSNETSRRYEPSCTILHRCDNQSGCCESTREVCTTKRSEWVSVYVLVYPLLSTNPYTAELRLRNDTECHCIVPLFRRRRAGRYSLNAEFDSRSNGTAYTPVCRCPRHFDNVADETEQSTLSTHVPFPNTLTRNCRCDCFENNFRCKNLKNGLERFATEERRCIAERTCNAPTCAKGAYNRETGRCPNYFLSVKL